VERNADENSEDDFGVGTEDGAVTLALILD
jgi:hypothetical protein